MTLMMIMLLIILMKVDDELMMVIKMMMMKLMMMMMVMVTMMVNVCDDDCCLVIKVILVKEVMSCDVSPVAMFLLVLINCCKLAIFVVGFKNDIKLWRERDWSANQKYSFCISPCLTQLIGPLKTQFPVVKYILARFFKYQTLSFDIVYDFVFVFFCVFVNTVW